MSSSDKSFIDKGVEHANRAIRADRAACSSENDAERYSEALAEYKRAIEYYKQAINFGKNPRTQEVLRVKCMEYLARATVMSDWLTANESKQAARRARKNAGGTKVKGAGNAKGTANAKGNTNGRSTSSQRSGGNGVGRARRAPEAEEEEEEEEPKEIDEESAKMRAALSSAIVTEKPNVRWSDVAGLTGAKDSLKEAVILPKKFPQMFVGKRRPWKGILLYGPPGTGKSFLAKAVATEADSFFISVSSSDLMSKWQGESEKMVKELFALAREEAPSIVFIDEIDSLVSSRSDNESESSRRIKTEFLVQMDGVGNGTDGVLILGATNIPWGLDDALLRRMERRVYIPLPDIEGRAHMFRLHLGDTPNDLSEDDVRELARRSEGYSGSDIKVLAADAVMEPVRVATSAKYFRPVAGGKFVPCKERDQGAKKMGLMDLESDQFVLPVVTCEHFMSALKNTKPSVSKESLVRHEEFTSSRGQEGR